MQRRHFLAQAAVALRKSFAQLRVGSHFVPRHSVLLERLPRPDQLTPASALNSVMRRSHSRVEPATSRQKAWSLRRSKSSTDIPCCSTQV